MSIDAGILLILLAKGAAWVILALIVLATLIGYVVGRLAESRWWTRQKH